LIGLGAFLPTYLQGVMGRTATAAGAVLAIESIAWMLGSIVAGRLMIRTSYRRASTSGAVLLVLGTGALVALEPAHGLAWAIVGTLLIGLGMGFCSTSLLVSVQASVSWSERGVATSSTLFARIIGQAVGAASFGAILNAGMLRHGGAASGAVDRLMTPALRSTLGADEIQRLVHALDRSLHEVYLAAGALAVVTLVLTRYLPAGLSPRRSG
jgi:MFS family permease